MRAGERISGINVKDISCIQTLGKFAALVMETFRKKVKKAQELILFSWKLSERVRRLAMGAFQDGY